MVDTPLKFSIKRYNQLIYLVHDIRVCEIFIWNIYRRYIWFSKTSIENQYGFQENSSNTLPEFTIITIFLDNTRIVAQ